MCIYFYLEIILLLFFILNRHYVLTSPTRKGSKTSTYLGTTKGITPSNLFFFIGMTFLISLFVLRADFVGGPDTINYIKYFQGDKMSYYFYSDPVRDFGFEVFGNLLRFVTKESWFFIAITSLISLLPLGWGIHKYSGDKVLSILFFMAVFPLMSGYMSAIRQVMSISLIVFGSIYFVEKHKNYKWVTICCFILAILFHFSSIIFLPFIISFGVLKVNNKFFYISLFVTWLLSSRVSNFFTIMDVFQSSFSGFENSISVFQERYSSTDSYVNKTLVNMLPLNLIPALFLYFGNKEDRNRPFLQIFTFGVISYNLLCQTQIGIRMTFIFFVFGLFSIPNNIKLKRSPLFWILLVMTIYFIWRTYVGYESFLNDRSYEDFFLPYYSLFEK